jgi:hypothetical protein
MRSDMISSAEYSSSQATLYQPFVLEQLRIRWSDLRLWAGIATVLTCGYALWGRAFAYIGIPAAKIFVGDVALILFLLCCTRAISDLWVTGLLRSTPLSGVSWGLIVFLFYGALELARGIALGQAPLPALQELVFNVYPLYFLMGLLAALTYKGIVGKIVRFMALVSCIWGLIYYLFLRNVQIAIPGASMIIVEPGGAALTLIGMSYFNLRRWWPIVAISAFFTLAGQVRGVWVGVSVALLVQAILGKQFNRIVWGFGSVALLLLVGFWTDFNIPSPEGRGGAVSSREIIGRAIAAVDENAAREYSPHNAAMYAGTAAWRKIWWGEIWSSVNAHVDTALLGHGYGYPLHDLVSYLRSEEDLRTPHSVFYFSLGYTGWIGVVIFFSLQGSIGLMLFRAWRVTGATFGFSLWFSSMVSSMFENTYETPFAAIPQYLLLGMAAADCFQSLRKSATQLENVGREFQQSRGPA